MAANVDSPKRQSLRLQNARVDADSGAPATSSGIRGPAKPRTSGTAKRLSAEKRRVDTGGQERSLGKRRSTESPHKDNETDKGPNDTAISTGRNKKRDFTESVHPTEPNTKTVDTTHSPGGEHSRNIRPRGNCDSSSLHVADSTREGSSSTDDNTSFSRDTRSSKSKKHEVPGASIAVRGLGEGAISSKEKNDAHLSEPNFEKDQGSEGPGESSSHDRSLRTRRSLRPRRSHDGSIANRGNTPRGAAGTNTPLQRQTRSSGRKDLERSEASTAIRGKGAISNKKKTENVHLAEPNSQKEGGVEDPGGSISQDRSLQLKRNHEGSSFNVEDSSSSTLTLNRKTRTSGAKDLEEHAVGRQGKSVVSSKHKNENPRLAETNSQQGEESEDPGGSSSHIISLQPRGNINGTNINVEDSPRGAGLSTGANASFSRETRSSKAKNYEEPGSSTAVKGLGESAVSRKEMKDNAHPTEPNSQEQIGSGGRGGSNSHNRSLQHLKSHEGPSIIVEDCPRGSSSPTKSHYLTSEEARSSKQKDCTEAGVSTAAKGRDSNALVRKEEQVIRPSNQNEKVVDISAGTTTRSPGKNLRPRRSHDGSGISSGKSVPVKGSDGKKEKRGEAEPIIQSGEVSQDPGGSISPRKNLKTNLNLEDPVDDRRRLSNVTTESNTGVATRDYKVQCCSKQLLQEVLGMCTGICKEILDSQQYLNEEQKQQHHKNFAWDFETAFQENVSVNGLSWHEAPDEDSEPDIKILEDQMDEVMVKTSMKRKRYPRKILSHFVKALKTEREILNQYKPAVSPRKVTLDPAFEFRMMDLSTSAATVCQHIHETKKALPIQLEKAEGFSQVLNLQPLLAESRIRKDIFYSRVMLEDISKSIPKVLETTLPESEPNALATPVRSLRKRRISLPQRHLYPIRSKRKISLES